MPDQAQMDEADRQQHREPAHQELRAPRARGKPFELNDEADAEQQREKRKRFQVDAKYQDRFDDPIERGPGGFGDQELFEDGNAESHHEVHGENAEQRNATQGIDGIDPLGRIYRPGRCGAIAHCIMISSRTASPLLAGQRQPHIQ